MITCSLITSIKLGWANHHVISHQTGVAIFRVGDVYRIDVHGTGNSGS